LAAGTYGYTITDSEGCTATGDFAVQEPAPVWTTFTQQYACGETANNGSAEVFANGGTPPYSYQWSNGATTAAINNLAPGMYGYTVTDALGCESASGLVCIFRSINTSTASSTNTSCAGDASGTATITVTQGLPPYTYAWSNGETTATITGLAAGMYAYTVTGQGGCSSSGAVIVNNGTDTEINLDVVNNANGSLTATASNGAAPYTYEWNNGETGPTATMYGAGSSYSVTATDADGCTATAAGITTGNTDPCAGINIGVDVDQSATGNLVPSISGNGTAPYTYEWSNGETTAIATGYAGGQSYTLTVTDANGCTATVSGTVETSSCPANITFPGTIAADQTLCAPGVVPDQLVEIAPASGGMGPIEYLWMSSTVTSDFSNAFFTPLPNSNTPNYQPGPINETTYFYRCVRRAGCVYLESNLVTITVGDDIDATIERPALGCFGETQTYSISGVAANATINWSFSGPVTVSGTSGSSVDVTFVGGGFLDVSVTITVDDCTGVFTDRVTINGNCLGGDDDTASSANTSSAITAYPNPTTDRALISFGETAATEVLLYNVNQQVIARYPVQADARNLAIDLRDQRQGLYFVQIINAQGEQQLLKLMKQ
ncbi:MAG: T9SS type A sorting domain-containing protein, partial [Bacteroidota bacterium]